MSLNFKILATLADGQFHSGQTLADHFQVSRARVWQAVKALRDLGVDIAAVQGRGYKIFDGLELLDAAVILQQCSETVRAQCAQLMILPETASTNAVLFQGLQAGEVKSGTVCLAEYQSKGRGRLGRDWVSPLGGNIYASIAWRFQSSASRLMGLSVAVGLAVAKTLEAVGVPSVQLKWPNDIFYQDQKIGGILIEVLGDALGPCDVVIGVGLNVRMGLADTTQIEQSFTDLSRILGDALSRNTLVAQLLTQVFTYLQRFSESQLDTMLDDWPRYDRLKDKTVQIKDGAQTLQAQVKGIDKNGQLIIESAGKQQQITSAYASIEMVGQ